MLICKGYVGCETEKTEVCDAGSLLVVSPLAVLLPALFSSTFLVLIDCML